MREHDDRLGKLHNLTPGHPYGQASLPKVDEVAPPMDFETGGRPAERSASVEGQR